MTPLHLSVPCDNLHLVDPEEGINMAFYGGLTPLHRSVREGNHSKTKTLLEKGAVVSSKDWVGNSPLHEAVRSKITAALVTA